MCLSQKTLDSTTGKAKRLILVYKVSAWQALRRHCTEEMPGDTAGWSLGQNQSGFIIRVHC